MPWLQAEWLCFAMGTLHGAVKALPPVKGSGLILHMQKGFHSGLQTSVTMKKNYSTGQRVYKPTSQLVNGQQHLILISYRYFLGQALLHQIKDKTK